MAKSMTGFGMGEFRNEEYLITVEAKTVNNKYLDINIKLPRKISFLEEKARGLIKDKVIRGRTDVYIKLESFKNSGVEVVLDKDLAKQYIDIFREIKNNFDAEYTPDVMDFLSLPDVVKTIESNSDEDLQWSLLSSALSEAFDKLDEMRTLEGKKLESDILKRIDILEKSILEVESLSDKVEMEYHDKLKSRISEILESTDIDESRIALEVAMLVDKSNITEEVVRFKSHISQFRNVVVKDEPIGRKLDFLIQEMNREVNTIGSKSSDIGITNFVIEIKTELEKIREQVQNIQ